MSGKREQLARLLDRTGVWRAVIGARSFAPSRWLTILTYHRVSDPAAETRFDTGVIDATPEQFERQVAFLAKHFNVISLSDLLSFIDGGKLPPKSVLITFDDGYRDCCHRVLPVLMRHGVTAVFFIATEFTDKRRLYWWDRIVYALHNAKTTSFDLTYPRALPVELSGGIDEAKGTLFRLVKSEAGLDVARFLDELFAAAGVVWNDQIEKELADELVMDWSEVQSLEAAGMDIESHTRSHRVLGTLSEDDLDFELAGAKQDLDKHLESPTLAVAYPVGYSVANDETIRRAVEVAGYRLGFTNQSGVNVTARALDPLDVKRCAMDIEMSDEMFRGIMAVPYLSRNRQADY